MELYIELQDQRKTLNKAIEELKKRGQRKAQTERDYRVALQQEILKLRTEGVPVTIISDLSRGKEEIADKKMERDIAESLYESALQMIYATKLNIGIIENQLNLERKGM